MSDACGATCQPVESDLPEAPGAKLGRQLVDVAQRRAWLAENRAALAAWNTHVAAHGLPLDAHRQF